MVAYPLWSDISQMTRPHSKLTPLETPQDGDIYLCLGFFRDMLTTEDIMEVTPKVMSLYISGSATQTLSFTSTRSQCLSISVSTVKWTVFSDSPSVLGISEAMN